jgi:hypothetical protein
MTITALPTPPTRSDPATFAARGDAFMTALPTFATEANALAADVTAKHATVVLDHDALIAAGLATVYANLASIQTNTTNIVAIQGAAAAAAAAAASYDSFDDRYLGAKAVAPTLDNDSAALLTGALYFDTVLNSMRVWSGSAWSNTLVEVDDRILSDQQLLGGIEYATDMALQSIRELLRVEPVLNGAITEYDAAITQMLYELAHLLDLAGVTARAIAGGDVHLRAGTATDPSLTPDGDPNTGLFFPAADTLAVSTAGIERLRMDANGYLGLGTSTPTGVLDVNDNRARIRTAKTPATSGAAGNAGEICWDTSYLYVCVATNTWKRVAIATW